MEGCQMPKGVPEIPRSYPRRSITAFPEWIETILETIDLGIFFVDRALILANVNPFVERLLKRERNDIIGRYLFAVIPFLDASQWRGIYTDVLTNGGAFRKAEILYEDPQDNGTRINTFLNVSLYPFKNRLNETAGVVTLIRDMTREVNLRQEIREWKEIMEDFIEETQIGVMVLDKDQKVIRYNRKAEENNKVERERVLHRTIYKVFPRNTMKSPHFSAHESMINNQLPYDINYDLYVPYVNDGKSTFRIRGTPLGKDRGYVLLVDREDSFYETKREMIKKTKDLELSTEYLYHLIDASPNAVISVDNRDEIISFNKTAQDIYGVEASKIVGRKYYFLFSADEHARIREVVLSGHSYWRGELIGLRKDGSPFPTQISISKIVNEDGKRIALLFLVQDITEEKMLKQRLIQSKKMAALGEMVGGLAHQLNNPLVGVVNMSDILTKSVNSDDPNFELIETIGEAASECRKIANGLLRFSGRSKSVFRELDLVQIIENSLLLVNRQFFMDGISIHKEYDQNIPTLMGDEVQLEQAFLNVAINAIQSMSRGGDFRVEVTKGHGRISGFGKGFVQVRFIDSGVGIPPQHLNKIFDPFFSTKDAKKGTGLGLSIAYTIIKEHNGTIDVESVEGKGTAITVQLPAHDSRE